MDLEDLVSATPPTGSKPLPSAVEHLVRMHIVEAQPYGTINVQLNTPHVVRTAAPSETDVLTLRTSGEWP